MSMPGWQDSHERASQNGDVIGPLTGQISPPEPGLTGPAETGPEKPASRAWIFACASRSAATSSWSCVAAIARAAQQRELRRSGRSRSVAAVDQADAQRRDLVALGLDLRRHLRLALLEPVEPRLGRGRVLLGVGDDVHDLRVLLGDPAHELGAADEVGEAVGLEHDGDGVRRIGLVEVDEALGERAADDDQPRPQARQPGALLRAAAAAPRRAPRAWRPGWSAASAGAPRGARCPTAAC